MAEYIITAFKVVVGVITSERLAIASLVALGLMLLWIVFSLIFSFQGKFARRAKKINEYISRNGMGPDARSGLNELISAMPSEFQRGYKNFEQNSGDLPSKHINRFDSLDVELSGGVFNQNKSILKTYTNIIFTALLLLSLGSLDAEAVISGYMLAEAGLIPLCFLFIAKILYYVYTAIRQFQYRVAVDEFNDMLDNMDSAYLLMSKNDDVLKVKNNVNVDVDALANKLKVYFNEYFEQKKANVDVANAYAQPIIVPEPEPEEVVETYHQEKPAEQSKKEIEIRPKRTSLPKPIRKQERVTMKEKTPVKTEKKLDFDTLLDSKEENAPVKRGRGRPKKEVSETGEFVISNDKEFEDALVRAEKLMRKNEQPLSASQTKRVEKQIKELVDAMTKYKESKK